MQYNRKYIEKTIGDNVADKAYHAEYLSAVLREDKKSMKLWRQAEDFSGFIKAIVGSLDPDIKYSQFAIYYFGVVKPDWYYRRGYCSAFAKTVFKTRSEGGSLKLGCNGMEVLIGNHYGDDINRVAIFDNDRNRMFDDAALHLFPYSDVTLKGEEINVYATDYTDEVVITLSGMWHVYSDDRFFALVKWSD